MVFIDGTWLYSNLRHLAKEYNQPSFYIDYGLLPQRIIEELEKTAGIRNTDLVRTFLFGSYPVNYDLVDEDRARKRKDFFSLLREDYHYEVEAYPIDYQRHRILYDDRIMDDSFSPKEKCVDIALASSMLYHAAISGSYDIAIAVVGDKDYFPLFQKVRSLGKRVAVASIRQSCAKVYSNRHDELKLKDFHIIWLNDLLDKIVWTPEESLVECKSPLHTGPSQMTTTVRLREDQPFFCDECRLKFADQRAEQLREYTSSETGDKPEECDGRFHSYHEGVIENLIPDRGFGFIRRADGASFFFHVTHLTNTEWESVQPGAKARFTIIKQPAGTKAGAAGEVILVSEGK